PGSIELRLAGAPSANVTVFNVLGRIVAQFTMQNFYDWNPTALPAGTYFIVASNVTARVSRCVVRN
ncbi:MAG: T9SS type A sorting domain-containing protein, partial [Candidatus Micrarchaeaceae archaeon]